MYNSLQPHGLCSPWNSPGQNTGVGSLSLLQETFPTQGSNPGLRHCRQILYQVSHKGSPIQHARLQHYVNQELPDIQAGFRKGRGARDQIANICWIIEKQGNFRKTSASVSLTMLKPLIVWITTNCGKFLKRWE